MSNQVFLSIKKLILIHPATIEEIKNRMDIVDVVGEYITLKRSGSSFKALSPFSAEKTPSFYVVPSKGIFKDFSSGKGGDAITFLMEIDGLSYVDALKFLAQKYGVEIVEEQQSDEAIQAQNKRESLYIVTKFANEYFQQTLHETDEGKAIGLSYFKERGITEESFKKFELGYSKELWDGLLNEATKKSYSKELLAEAGLVILKEGKSYDRFRSRVMFPIHNVSGKPIAFAGRKLSSTDKSAKYINSPETELYHKSKVLYGLFQGKNAVRKEDLCYLVEGYTDVISMHQVGVENVVASSGTALTQDQIRLIRRYTENVAVIYDGDAAGIRASFRGIDMLLEGGLNVKAVALPDGEDPDSYARNLGALGFKEYLNNEAQDIIRFKTKILLKDTADDPVKKAGMIKDIISSVIKVADPVKRNVYIQECSNLLGISEQVLIAEQNKLLIEQRRTQRNEPTPPAFDIPPPSFEEDLTDKLDIGKIIELQERESIRVLLNYGDSNIQNKEMKDVQIIAYILNELEEIQFSHPTYRKILEICREAYERGELINGKKLIDHEEEEIRTVAVDLMMEKYSISNNWFDKYEIIVPQETDFLKDVTFSNILRLKFRIVQQLIKEEQEKLKNLENDTDLDELLDEIQELKQMEVEIAKILGNVITA